MNLSAEVLKHQPMVEKYAKEYGISEYVNVLLAIIQVESGGTAEDVMQLSLIHILITEFLIILFGDLPPLSMIEGAFLKYFGIPVFLTWFMSQKTFDGKKPYSFLKSQITYALRPKITYAGKAVKLDKQILHENITAVRSVNYVPDEIYRQ